jgi:hypothetical protein
MTMPAQAGAATIHPRSGGPRTPEGKERSRQNALKHGLRAKRCWPEVLLAVIRARKPSFRAEFRPCTDYQRWLVDQVVLATARIDTCLALIRAAAQRRRVRDERCWDLDRAAEAAELATKLPKDPTRIVAALRQTKHGADWLIQRWEMLGEALRHQEDWTFDQWELALHLLGVPTPLHTSQHGLPATTDLASLLEMVAGQLAELRALRDGPLAEIDQRERAWAVEGRPAREDREAATLRRYEASCRRDLRWALEELRRVRGGAESPSAAASEPEIQAAASEPEIQAATSEPEIQAATVEPEIQAAAEARVEPAPEAAGEQAPHDSGRRSPGEPAAQAARTPNGAATPSPRPAALGAPHAAREEAHRAAPAGSAPNPEPAPKPLSRRARKELERRAREAAKRERAKARRTARQQAAPAAR